MAAEESSQGAALGPKFSEFGGDPPARSEFPKLQEVRLEFLGALSVLEMVCRALEGTVEEPPKDIGPFAMAFRHGVTLLNAAYERFDLALVGYDDPDEGDPGGEGAQDEGHHGTNDVPKDAHAQVRRTRGRGSSTLVA